jgi:hypothetical protein
MTDSLISVKSINMEKINTSIGDFGGCLVEAHPPKGRPFAIPLPVMTDHLLINHRLIGTGVKIAGPKVNCVTARFQTVFLNCLAKSEIGISRMCPQFEKNPWPNHPSKPVGKGQMAPPRNRIFNPQGKETAFSEICLHLEKNELI